MKARTVTFVSLALLGVCGILLLFHAYFSCSVHREANISLGVHDFQIFRTSCGQFAKGESISVSINRKGTEKRDVIFEYEPDERNPLPNIKRTPDDQILISIPMVRSVFFKYDEWYGTGIRYDIGTIHDGRKFAEDGECKH